MYPWRRSCVSTETLRLGRKCSLHVQILITIITIIIVIIIIIFIISVESAVSRTQEMLRGTLQKVTSHISYNWRNHVRRVQCFKQRPACLSVVNCELRCTLDSSIHPVNAVDNLRYDVILRFQIQQRATSRSKDRAAVYLQAHRHTWSHLVHVTRTCSDKVT